MKTDKILHFLAGYAISMTVWLWNPWMGLAAGVLAGTLKELIYDRALGKGTPDGRDFWVTVAGTVVAFGITLIRILV